TSFTPRGSGVRTPRRPPSSVGQAVFTLPAPACGARRLPMKSTITRSAALAAVLGGALMLQGCLVGAAVGTAGAVVGGAASATGTVGGPAVDAATTSDERTRATRERAQRPYEREHRRCEQRRRYGRNG